MTSHFANKVALVTGGSKGVGRAIALALASEGAAIGLTWFRDREAMEKTVGELEEIGGRVHTVKAHLGDPEVPANVVDEVRSELGEPDFLISNAASGTQRPLKDITASHWEWTMQTNAAAFLRLVQAAPHLRSVIAMSSLGAGRVLADYGIVGASKAALESLVRYLAVELAPRCRVNAISPGVIDTDSLRKFPQAETLLQAAEAQTPISRLASPEDVAQLATFLLSETSAMITGQTIVIDGGYSLGA